MTFVREFLRKEAAVAALVLAGSFLHGTCLARGRAAQQTDEVRPGDAFESTGDLNRRLNRLSASIADADSNGSLPAEYRIGSNDVLEIHVFGAQDLNQKVRVSAAGNISMLLIGSVKASGLTAQELETAIQNKLRVYMNEPNVSVFVFSVESHPVSVLGEVSKPGVFQIRGPKTLLEMLSMAQGLADDAGDTVLVMRGAGLAQTSTEAHLAVAANSTETSASETSVGGAISDGQKTIYIDLKHLLDSGDPHYNVPIYSGDIIKVTKAGIVYVVGGVKRPGGFVMRSNEEMSLLKAIALAEGVDETAAKRHTRIIHTDEITGRRSETPVDLGKILAGKAPDVPLKPADIVFVPRSNSKAALLKGTETSIATASGFIIFHP